LIDKQLFRAILHELIDENPIACRAVLSICDVEFSGSVETLAVTLSKPVVLKVNLRFLQEHCHTENQVKAVLVQEFSLELARCEAPGSHLNKKTCHCTQKLFY